jgi:hypothetical protein
MARIAAIIAEFPNRMFGAHQPRLISLHNKDCAKLQ